MKRHTLTKEEAWNYPSPEFWGRFPLGYVSIIASKPGCGKTWYMLHCMSDFSRKGNVGAFIGDCAPSLIYDRIKRITNTFAHGNVYCYFLSEMQKEKAGIDYSKTDEAMFATRKIIVEQELKVLFIDTLVSFMTGDESSQKEVSPIMQGFVKLATETKCAIIINHHLRKGNAKQGEDLDEIIGSSVLTRLASVVLTMKRQDETTVTISCAKNWFTSTETTKFKLLNNEGAITTIETLYTTTATNSVDLFEYVKEKQKEQTFPAVELAKVAHISVSTLRDVVSRLLSEGLVGDLTPKEKCIDKLLIRR